MTTLPLSVSLFLSFKKKVFQWEVSVSRALGMICTPQPFSGPGRLKTWDHRLLLLAVFLEMSEWSCKKQKSDDLTSSFRHRRPPKCKLGFVPLSTSHDGPSEPPLLELIGSRRLQCLSVCKVKRRSFLAQACGVCTAGGCLSRNALLSHGKVAKLRATALTLERVGSP